MNSYNLIGKWILCCLKETLFHLRKTFVCSKRVTQTIDKEHSKIFSKEKFFKEKHLSDTSTSKHDSTKFT